MLHVYTVVHVIISLVAIAAGIVVLHGLLTGRRLDRWTFVFLLTTVLTSVTGFAFPLVGPFAGVTPAFLTGVLSMIVLPVAVYARYPRQMKGGWRRAYVITAVAAFYLNIVALIAQGFLHVPLLKKLAPTQQDPGFAVAQGLALVAFIVLGVFAARRFRAAAV